MPAASYATNSLEVCQAVKDVEALRQQGDKSMTLKQLRVRLPKDEEDNACFEHRVFGWPPRQHEEWQPTEAQKDRAMTGITLCHELYHVI